MVVIVLSACPAGLRGHLTRWLVEISAGVFVGHVSARVRDLLGFPRDRGGISYKE
jgi:CRISPR-associated protein Cas2